jgi:hypothetical protein
MWFAVSLWRQKVVESKVLNLAVIERAEFHVR